MSAEAPRLSPRQVARIIFDARAKPHLFQQFQIIERSLFQPLRLQELMLCAQHFQAFLELQADILRRLLHSIFAGHIVAGGIDTGFIDPPLNFSRMGSIS